MYPDTSPENTLELTSSQFRELGYKAIDLIADNLDRLQNRLEPARRAVPPELREQLLTQNLPQRWTDPREWIEFVDTIAEAGQRAMAFGGQASLMI
jgi:hypothetical protein